VREAADDYATKTTTEAESKASAMVIEAERRVADLVSDAEERLPKIRVEREAVGHYLQNLRGVLTEADSALAGELGEPAKNDQKKAEPVEEPATQSEETPVDEEEAVRAS